jgi:excisionase family DNA binding protein
MMLLAALLAMATVPAAVFEPQRLTVNVREAARMLGISPRHLTVLLDEGVIRSVRAGRRRLVPISAIHSFVEGEKTAV